MKGHGVWVPAFAGTTGGEGLSNEPGDQTNRYRPIGRASAPGVGSRRQRRIGHHAVRRLKNLSFARRRRAVAAAAGFSYQRGRVLCRGRPVRLRQVHVVENDLRVARAFDRRDPGRRRAGDEAARQCRHRVPERAAAAMAQHLVQRDVADRHEEAAARRISAAGESAVEAGRARRVREETALAALRRHAATCLDLPRAGARSEDHADGRAVRRARRHDAREDECRTDAHPARDRQDRAADHALDSGSGVPGRPRACHDRAARRDRGDLRRAAAAPAFTRCDGRSRLHRTGATDSQTFLHPKRAGLKAGLMPYRLAVRDVSFFERPVTFARPFRFGAVVINATPQAFVRVEIEVEGKGSATGASAEFLVPKWFDKRQHLSPEETVGELRRSLLIARELYLAHSGFETAFGLHAACIGAQIQACAREDIPPLAAAYGPAEIDKAILDALLRCADVDFFDGMAGNIAGVNARLSRDLDDADVSRFLAGRQRLERVAIRHTVGMDDRVEGEGGVADQKENAGARYFKLKLNGDPAHDTDRLTRIGNELATLPYDYRVTLDANEQYADLAGLSTLVDRLDRDAALRPIAQKLLYIEQPMPRDITRQSPLGALARRDFIVDEADESYDAFPVARALGYRGISSKSCKGIYKSVINATRAAKWSAGGEKCFIAGEDLTCQAGLAVQQDLALGALIGVTHAERNGHHYVDGFGDTPAAEADAFLVAHPDLYISDGHKIRLAIHDGDLLTGSLTTPGFATSVHPDWSTMQPLAQPAPRISLEKAV